MQTLWNIQPTCSSGNMAVGEEAPRVVHPRAFTLDAPHFTRFTDRLPDRRTRDASLSRPRRELDHPGGGEQRGDAEVSSKAPRCSDPAECGSNRFIIGRWLQAADFDDTFE